MVPRSLGLVILLVLLAGCSGAPDTTPDPNYLENEAYCTSDEDCQLFCCSSCGNKYWIEENNMLEVKCCYVPPEGKVTGCRCMDNACEQVFAST